MRTDAVCNILNIRRSELTKLVNSGMDLYSAISKLSGLSRSDAKLAAHALSYDGLPNLMKGER